VSETNGNPGARRLWTAYVAAITLFVVVGEARDAAVNGLPSAARVGQWVLTAALLTAGWGYALRRPLGTAAYWRVVFWIEVAATAVGFVPVVMAGRVAISIGTVLLALLAPAFVAAYRYAHRSPEIWRGQPG
jgi:hypothetical protein